MSSTRGPSTRRGPPRRFYARANTALSVRFLAALDDAVGRVFQFPQAGSPHLHGTRTCRLHRFPFSLVYVEQPTRSLVIAVAHHRRRPGYWRRRLP